MTYDRMTAVTSICRCSWVRRSTGSKGSKNGSTASFEGRETDATIALFSPVINIEYDNANGTTDNANDDGRNALPEADGVVLVGQVLGVVPGGDGAGGGDAGVKVETTERPRGARQVLETLMIWKIHQFILLV